MNCFLTGLKSHKPQLQGSAMCPPTCMFINPHLFKHFQEWWLYHFPEQSVLMLCNLAAKKIFSNIQFKPPCTTWGSFLSFYCLFLGRGDWFPPGYSLLPGTCRVRRSPLSLLQAKHPQLLQLLFITIVLHCLSLDALQCLNVFVVMSGPKIWVTSSSSLIYPPFSYTEQFPVM